MYRLDNNLDAGVRSHLATQALL